jgi:DNA-binding transcriptional MocR family regulator
MPKEAVFTMKLEPALRDEFMAEAHAMDRSASQLARELMREFVLRQHEARAHDAFVRRKVKAARAEVVESLGRTNEAVEADFAARRDALLRGVRPSVNKAANKTSKTTK